MKIIDAYNNYKTKYKEYVVLIKSGIFYNVLNDDVSIIYSLFHYKIKNNGNNYIVGFPKSSINKVVDTLKSKKINYIVLDKNEEVFCIFDKYKSTKNNYNNYCINLNRLNYISYKINDIYSKLNNKIFDKDIEEVLLNIDKLL